MRRWCSRFNMGEGQEENAIVTSTGQFVVAWDFAKVKKGHLDKYEIKKWVHVEIILYSRRDLI